MYISEIDRQAYHFVVFYTSSVLLFFVRDGTCMTRLIVWQMPFQLKEVLLCKQVVIWKQWQNI